MRNKNIDIAKTLLKFKNVEGNDPKIVIQNNNVELTPYYWNYSFTSNVLPFIFSLFLFMIFKDTQTQLLLVLSVIVFLYLIIDQLSSNNELVIDVKDETLLIIPNIITKLWKKERLIRFNEIKNVTQNADTFSPLYKRFNIKCTLKNNTKIRLISAPELKKAMK